MLQDSLPLGAAAWGFFVDREGRVLASTHADVSVGELPDFASALQTGVADAAGGKAGAAECASGAVAVGARAGAAAAAVEGVGDNPVVPAQRPRHEAAQVGLAKRL